MEVFLFACFFTVEKCLDEINDLARTFHTDLIISSKLIRSNSNLNNKLVVNLKQG